MKKIFSKYRILIACSMLTIAEFCGLKSSQAQFQVALPGEVKSISDLWSFSVSNSDTIDTQVELRFNLYNDNDSLIYCGISSPMLVPATRSVLCSDADFCKVQVELPYRIPGFKKPMESILPGEYSACLEIYNIEDPEVKQTICSLVKVRLLSDSISLPPLQLPVSKSFAFHGVIGMTGFYAVDPQTSSHTYNTQFSFSPQLTIAGLPFDCDLYYDTDSDFYVRNVPMFQVHFDAQDYKSNLLNKYSDISATLVNYSTEEIVSAGDKIMELKALQTLTSEPLVQEIVTRLQSGELLNNIKNDSLLLQGYALLEDSATSRILNMVENDSICLDSSEAVDRINIVRDSISQIKNAIQQRIDTGNALYQQALGYKSTFDKQASLEAFVESDPLSLALLDRSALSDSLLKKGGLDSLKQLNATNLSASKLNNLLSGLNTFDVGQTTPFISDLLISNVLLNGIHIDYKVNDWTYTLIGGRINDMSTFYNWDKEETTFSKLILGGVSRETKGGSTLSLFTAMSDFSQTDSLQINPKLVSDHVLFAGYSSKLSEDLLWCTELAISYCKSVQIGNVGTAPSSLASIFWPVVALSQVDELESGIFTDKALRSVMSGKIARYKTTWNIQSKYVGAGFYTPGNPYLINNMFEVSAGAGQGFLKNKLFLDLTVYGRDYNIDTPDDPNQLSYGVAASLQTSFPKWPRLTANYRPDVVFSDMEKIIVRSTSAIMQYPFRILGLNANLSTSYVSMKQDQDVEDISQFEANLFTLNQQLYLNKAICNMGYYAQKTISEDSIIAFDQFNFSVQYPILPSISLFGNLILTDPFGAYYLGWQSQIAMQLMKKISISANYTNVANTYQMQQDPYYANYQDLLYLSISYNF